MARGAGRGAGREALARVIPGRPGYWLELGLIMFATYMVGCAVGSWLRDWMVSRARRPPESGAQTI